MSFWDLLKGNEYLKKFFQNEIAHHTLNHAYILEGEEGTGRHTLARLVAYALAENHPAKEKILQNNSVDVKEIGIPPDKKVFTVDYIRKMKADTSILPNDLDFKFYILSNTECMNEQAQNAALKILEEPPKNTYFFLLCENAASLLPTVRSRAQILRMERFSNEKLEDLLLKNKEVSQKKESDPDYFHACVRTAAGSYGKALANILKKDVGAAKSKANRLLSLLKSTSKSEILLGVDELPQKRNEFEEVLELFLTALRDILLVRSMGNENLLLYFSNSTDAENAGERLTKAALLSLYEKAETLKKQLSFNINMQNAKLKLTTDFIKILEF